jgi:hypothetical protein
VSQTTFPSLRNDAQVATDSTRLKSRLLSKAHPLHTAKRFSPTATMNSPELCKVRSEKKIRIFAARR